MKGVFIRLEKQEIKDAVEEMLETETAVVDLCSSTSNLVKLRNSKAKLERDFLMTTEETDMEIEKLRTKLPAVEVGEMKFTFSPQLAKPQFKTKKARREKYEKELKDIKSRLNALREK